MLASDIITGARYILSDTAKDRWSDTRLLTLLNDAITDTAKTTTLFIENFLYVVQNNIADIDLSALVTKVVGVEYLDKEIPLYSYEEMCSKYGPCWQQDTGDEVLAIVYDKQRNGLFKQYPLVSNAQNDFIVYNGTYGIITSISYSDIVPTIINTFGDIGDIPNEALLKFYYVRKHSQVTMLGDILYIDDLLKNPFIHYVAGMALRDNQDTQNRQMAAEELNFYSAMKEEYKIEKMENFVRSLHEVRYRPND